MCTKKVLSFVVGLIAVCLFFVTIHANDMSCISENGSPVDWWVIMKVPILPNVPTDQGSGYGYAYGDSNSNGLITLTNNRLDTFVQGALGSTLAPIYSGDPSTDAWILYNDQFDGSSHESYGHTKGVVAFNSSGGFWLVHSTPRFPPKREQGYIFPENERNNGQSFLCMSLGGDSLNTVGLAFLLNKPFVYESNMPQQLNRYAPYLRQVLDGNFITKIAASNSSSITTVGGANFAVFSKNGAWGSDLYSDLVEPTISSGLLIETWMNGANTNKMPTYCTPQYQYDSINIRQVTFSPTITWPETKDHSKWAIATQKANLFCIGDVNRQFSQSKRGGGTVCGVQAGVYKSLKAAITSADSCN